MTSACRDGLAVEEARQRGRLDPHFSKGTVHAIWFRGFRLSEQHGPTQPAGCYPREGGEGGFARMGEWPGRDVMSEAPSRRVALPVGGQAETLGQFEGRDGDAEAVIEPRTIVRRDPPDFKPERAT